MLFALPRNAKIGTQQNGTNITLEETLRPLWKLTYYSGILLDWCRPVNSPYRLCKIMHYAGMSLWFSLLLSVMVFEFIQLILVIGNMSNIHAVVPNLIWFTPLALTILTYFHYLRRRREFLSFFEDWRCLEEEFTNANTACIVCESKKIHLFMYAAYVVMTIGSLVSLGFEIRNNPEAPYLISSYPSIRETLSLFVIGSIHLIAIFLAWTLLSLSDFVPSFIHYHAALAVSCLENNAKVVFTKYSSITTEVKRISPLFPKKFNMTSSSPIKPLKGAFEPTTRDLDLASSIRIMWTRFENINEIINRSNYLFGCFMVYGQGGGIFLITTLLYSVLYNLEDALNLRFEGAIVVYVLNFIAMIFRFTSCLIISSQLHRSVGKFSISLNYLLSQHWDRMSKEERDLLRSFISRLRGDHLAANPLGLYNITPTTLLTIFGLVVSYVIVLLQSK